MMEMKQVSSWIYTDARRRLWKQSATVIQPLRYRVDIDPKLNHSDRTIEGAKAQNSIVSVLRHLDMDDFYLLKLLGEGQRLTDAAKALSLSQPAITQRMYKIENAIGIKVLDRSSRTTLITSEGKMFCENVAKILSQLEGLI
ncbi:MAG: LysR family transcriptional regulator [Proteobacteria bacterium]|nr:LysR family transcriptional regulator [Pseudomonadota bacterium]